MGTVVLGSQMQEIPLMSNTIKDGHTQLPTFKASFHINISPGKQEHLLLSTGSITALLLVSFEQSKQRLNPIENEIISSHLQPPFPS
jgi:hypothetical protein